MAKKGKILNTKFVFLRKLGAGLLVICFTVFVCGQVFHGVSARSVLYNSSLLIIAIGLFMQVVLKVWTSFDDIQDRQSTKKMK